MGQCALCCRLPSPPDRSSYHLGTIEKDTGPIDVSETGDGHIVPDVRTPMVPPDSQINGNSRCNVLSVGLDSSLRSEKRMFYPRIPPLGRVGGGGGGKEPSESKINALFEQYKDPNDDAILAEGIERLCSDLDLNPDEYKVLLLAWKFNAEQMCRFTRSEFVSGCKAMRVDSIRGLQNKLPELVLEVQDPEKFKDLYRFTFRFGLDVEIGQRILPCDMATCLWRLVFTQKTPVILDRWLQFLKDHPHIRGIPRDTWNMFLNFIDTVSDDLSCYDDSEAWPSLFDDFVEYDNDQANQNITKDKDLPERKDESE